MDFAHWLQNELDKRDWSQSELVKRSQAIGAKVSQTQLSNVLLGRRQAGPETCIAIARTLGIPNEEVFRVRGWLPATKSEIDPLAYKLAREISDLPSPSKEITLEAMQAMLQLAQKFTSEIQQLSTNGQRA